MRALEADANASARHEEFSEGEFDAGYVRFGGQTKRSQSRKRTLREKAILVSPYHKRLPRVDGEPHSGFEQVVNDLCGFLLVAIK